MKAKIVRPVMIIAKTPTLKLNFKQSILLNSILYAGGPKFRTGIMDVIVRLGARVQKSDNHPVPWL